MRGRGLGPLVVVKWGGGRLGPLVLVTGREREEEGREEGMGQIDCFFVFPRPSREVASEEDSAAGACCDATYR